jgi:MFS family permease
MCFAVAVSGTNLHSVPYLIGIGYAPARAALALSILLAFGGTGKLLIGWTADRMGARIVLAADLLAMAMGISLLMAARHRLPLAGFVTLYGFTVGAPLALLPLAAADSLGLKRFGSLYGLLGVFHTTGAAIGPLMAGRIFDISGTYSAAFELFAVMALIGGVTVMGCAPLPAEMVGAAPVPARA